MKRFLLACLLLGEFQGYALSAGVTLDSQEQRLRAQRETEERLARQQALDIRLPEGGAAYEGYQLPAERPCFRIDVIRLEGERLSAFPWTEGYLKGYAGQCIGREGINLIVKQVSNRLIERGYITTRVGIPEQDLSHGMLRLTLVPGIIRFIKVSDKSDFSWKTALPFKSGDILNLRDIEQGLEQIKRIPSQDADIKILPGEAPGESDIVLTVTQSRPWRISLSLDDSGASATGRLQGAINLAYDNLFGINDSLNLGVNSDAQGTDRQRGTRGNSLSYSIPWGYWTLTLSGSSYRFHQTVKGQTQDFISSGESTTGEVRIQRVVHRNQNSKTAIQARLAKRHSKSFIEDTEIESQRRDTTAAEIGIVHRHYLGPTQIDLTLAHREGVPWFNGQEDASNRPTDSPTFRYRIQTLDVAAMMPFRVAELPMRWLGALRVQETTSPLYATEFFSIGNRWTVRGFDGDQTLAAERGWYLRNEIEIPLGKSGQAAYFGIDHGEVGGPSTATLPGNRLTGAVLGLRGGWKGTSYDIFIGSPVEKPEGMQVSTTAGFQLAYQY